MSRWMRLLAVAALALVPCAGWGGEDKPAAKANEPTVVVQAKSFEALFEDIRYFAKLVDRGDDVEQMDGLIKTMTGDGGLASAGFDVKRPFLGYVCVTPSGFDSPFAIMIPVLDEAKFLKLLDTVGIAPTRDKEGIYTMMAPGSPVAINFRFINGYLYLSAMDKSHLKDKHLIAPEKLTDADANLLLGINARFDRIPDEMKQLLLQNAELRLTDIKERAVPGESKEDEINRRRGIEAMSFALRSIVSEGKSLEVRATVDREKDDFGFSLSLDGMPNTNLNTAISFLGQGRTRLAAADNSAIHVGLNLTVPELFRPFLEMGAKDIVAREADATKKAFAEKLLSAITPTLQRGELDVHITATNMKPEGPFSVLAAVGVDGGEKIETAVKELVAKMPESDRSQIQLDAGKAGTVSLHKVTIDAAQVDEQSKRIFGENPCLWTGFCPKAVVLGVGANGSDTVGGIQTVEAAQPSPAIVIDASLIRLAALDTSHVGAVKLAQTVFAGMPTGSDRVRITLDGGKKLKFTTSFKGAVIKYGSQLRDRHDGL